jgi:peptidoglycan/LPS O-acetylase OafA/YrhL
LNVQNPRFPLFDSLRAIAALSVLAFHIAFVLHGFDKPGYGDYLVQLNIGVPIFFLISGFLLYRPFVAARYAGQGLPAVGPYAIRRFFRIVPAYWVALPIVAAWTSLHAVFDDPLPYFGFAQVYERRSLISGYGIAWTLCIEVTFYALLPLWALAMRRLPARTERQFVVSEAVPLALIFATACAWNATQIEVSGGSVVFSPAGTTLPSFLDHFALGMGLAVASVALARRERQPPAVRIVHRAPWAPWLVAGIAYVALCNVDRSAGVAGELARHQLRGVVAFGVLLPAVFGDDRGGAVRRLLADRRLQWIGLISYSLYLWHPAITTKIAAADWDGTLLGWPGFAAAAVAVCIGVAAASFYVVERPALWIGRRLAGRGGYQEPERPPGRAVDRPGATSAELAGVDRGP